MKLRSSPPFRLQHDQCDCGVACLRNILNYYKAEVSLEKLREWSGTGLQGSSLLGLHQAAGQAGFTAQGARACGLTDLDIVEHPCILHVSPDGMLLPKLKAVPDVQLVGDFQPSEYKPNGFRKGIQPKDLSLDAAPN